MNNRGLCPTIDRQPSNPQQLSRLINAEKHGHQLHVLHTTMSLVIHFLTQLRQQVRRQEGETLGAWLQVAPEAGRQYHELAQELRTQYRQQSLDTLVDHCLPEEDDLPEGQGSPWSSFNTFIKDYFVFWRDVNFDDLVAAHELLSTLVK